MSVNGMSGSGMLNDRLSCWDCVDPQRLVIDFMSRSQETTAASRRMGRRNSLLEQHCCNRTAASGYDPECRHQTSTITGDARFGLPDIPTVSSRLGREAWDPDGNDG